MTRWVRAVRRGWVVENGVPGPDVDADVLAVHEQGRRMPRKSTYFPPPPKPRSGLLLADLAG